MDSDRSGGTLSNALLVLWVALLGADRIDVAGGHAPFILTPFLALTPAVALSEMVRRSMRRSPLVIPVRAVAYVAVSTALLCVALISSVLSLELTVSAARTALLIADVTGALTVALLCADRRDMPRLLATGAMLSLLLFIAADIGEALFWISRGPEILRVGSVSLRFDEMQSLGPIPRLPGLVADGNRAGFVLLFYAVVIARGEPRAFVRRTALTVAAILLVLPLSRSATLAVVATLAVALVTDPPAISGRMAATGTLAAALIAGVFLVYPNVLDSVASAISSPIAKRLSSSEGSAQSHVALIERGVHDAMESIPRATIGLGYGNSYLMLQDMFPGNRYGNYHSLYVTMLAESGVFALLLMLVLMATPLVVGGPWRPMIAGAFAFNLFYQTTTEPVFWFLLAAAWLTMPGVALSASSAPAARHLPSVHS